ncbi:hypothetical protein LTS14_007260 [Recurvomyces mirabilis]|uniref:uncharacterized protein n=1 Tax=Recurvomyces mirabilis TaxID=574656 RepID=UPI002DDEDEED|nr:hypothetical protein LTS14_007260 [Recurvomyces mirabilis]
MAKSPVVGRVAKRGNSGNGSANGRRMSTRQQSRLAEMSSSREGTTLQDMVDQVSPPLKGTKEDCVGQGTETEGWVFVSTRREVVDEEEDSKTAEVKKDQVFPLFNMPPEIRNEIYRACLTRPFNILLSKKEPPEMEPEAKEDGSLLGLNDAEVDVSEVPSGPQPRPWHSFAQDERDDHVQCHVQRVNAADAPRNWANRRSRSARLSTRTSGSSSSTTSQNSVVFGPTFGSLRSSRSSAHPEPPKTDIPRIPRPQDSDPLIVALLRTNKQIYQEARSILYSENHFTLDLSTSVASLSHLHQRSRRQIKRISLEIPCYNEILERFQETVRLSLRYCWGLKCLTIHMPFTLPGADGSGTTGNTAVYANGFDILRWLPRPCEVRLKGNVGREIEAVVARNANLARTLDELAYARRQLIANEASLAVA